MIDLQGSMDAQGQLLRRLVAVLDTRPHPLGNSSPLPSTGSITKHLYPNGGGVLWDATSESGSNEVEEDVTSPNSRRRKKGKERLVSVDGVALES
jgi:hypothetical protein